MGYDGVAVPHESPELARDILIRLQPRQVVLRSAVEHIKFHSVATKLSAQLVVEALVDRLGRGRSQEPSEHSGDHRNKALVIGHDDILLITGTPLLRARRERPRRRAADERDELATLHSITSSARVRSMGGTARPMAFAAFKLITSSSCVGNSIGSSAGVAPLKILSMYTATRRAFARRLMP